MQSSKEAFLELVRLGIGHSAGILPLTYNWEEIQALAEAQGLSGVLVDGIEKLPDGQKPPKPVLLQWIGEVLQGYEYRYELYRRTIGEMAAFYNEHGFKMMVLKGYACCLDWPKPEHRPTGDIDIWQFGRQKEADAVLAKEKGIKIDKSQHHHTVFYWRNFVVENHYDFVNIHYHSSLIEFESVLKELGRDDTHFIEIDGIKVYLPSPHLHALFIFETRNDSLRSKRDNHKAFVGLVFFAKTYGLGLDWAWLEKQIEFFGMKKLYDIFNAICVCDLGFDVKIFPNVKFDPFLKERVLNEILSPEFNEKEPGCFLLRIPFKYRRWKANEWKHELCYNESMKSAFWCGVKSHIMKLSSI